MTGPIDLYWLHFIVVAFAMLVMLLKCRHNLLAPVPAFCIALTYSFYSDFLVRGYNDDLIAPILPGDLLKYQLIILTVYVAAMVAVLSLRSTTGTLSSPLRWDNRTDNLRCELVAWAGAILDIVKRLFMTQWSLTDALGQSLGPRGGNSWSSGGSLGDGTFILGLTLMLLPASGICFATLLTSQSASAARRLRALVGLLIISALLYSYGSRTYLAVPLLYACVRYTYSNVSLFKRVTAWILLCVVVAVLFSMLIHYRSSGIETLVETGQDIEIGNIQYHEDDSYYRILYACYISETSNSALDAKTFFYTIAVNPIPRYMWSSKPALLDDFWGDYKPYYITMTFLGEFIALFGLWAGPSISLVFLTVVFLFIDRGYALVSRPLGLGIYFMILFYAYQCLRSVMGVTMSAYFPLAIIGLSYLIARRNVSCRSYSRIGSLALRGESRRRSRSGLAEGDAENLAPEMWHAQSDQ